MAKYSSVYHTGSFFLILNEIFKVLQCKRAQNCIVTKLRTKEMLSSFCTVYRVEFSSSYSNEFHITTAATTKFRRKKTDINTTNCITASVKYIPDTCKSILSSVYTSCIDLVEVQATVQNLRYHAKFSGVTFLAVYCALKEIRLK